jgi:hypothetical protein
LITLVVLAPSIVIADGGTPDLAKLLPPDGDPSGAAFAFAGKGVYANASARDIAADLPNHRVTKNVVGRLSGDKRAYWASADLASGAKSTVDGHASALWEKTDTGWKLVAFSVVPTVASKEQRAANQAGVMPPKITAANGASGVYFMTIFRDIFRENADVTVSERKDAVLFGSAAKERFVGGPAIRKAMKSWRLAFTVRDDIAWGTTKGRMLWIAANMDARPLDKPKATPVPYRVFLIYEGDAGGNDYELVHGSFSAMTEQGWPP